MTGELQSSTEKFLVAIDAMDVDSLMSNATTDAQGVDELSRRWLRGTGELESYLRRLAETVSEVHTELSDSEERVTGDVGILTCWLDQRYTLDGQVQHVSAPTTMVFRREDGEWKLALFHSIPLPQA
jgi:ketosteroid isomerase-like protein